MHGRVCLSEATLRSHSRSHNIGPIVEYNNRGVASFHQFGKQCKSVPGLKRHMRVYSDSTTNSSAQSNVSCDYCGLKGKSLAGKKSHMRAKHQ